MWWAFSYYNLIIYIKFLVIQPRRFKWKRVFKNRLVTPFKETSLCFGRQGLKTYHPSILTSKQLTKIVLLAKKAARKRQETERYFWVRTFPNTPTTRKVLNSRMGKGKGKFKGWSLMVKGGSMFCEFLRLKHGRLLYYKKQIESRIHSPLRTISLEKGNVPLFQFRSRMRKLS